MRLKKVSVIIPLFNAERWIESTIKSVVNQNYYPIEIIVVDDCSTDNSADIIKKIQRDIPYLKYYRMEQNSGVGLARNKGIEISSGIYLAFLDSDDIWHSEKLTKQLALFEQNPSVPLTFTAIQYIDENGMLIKKKRNIKQRISFKYLLRNTMIATSSVIINRKVVKDCKMPNRKSGEDYSTWLSILKKYGDALGINEALTSYRISNTSLSHNRANEIRHFYAVQTEDIGISKICACINTIFYIFNAVKKHYL